MQQIRCKKILLGLSLLGLLNMAQAQQDTEQNQPEFIENQWGIGCTMAGEEQRFICDLNKSIVRADTGQSLMTFLIRNLVNSPGDNELVVRLPHGVNIQSGVELSVDEGDKVAIPILRTDAQGVLAGIELSDDVNQQLKQGSNAIVTFMLGNQVLNVQFSLLGYTKAFDKLNAG